MIYSERDKNKKKYIKLFVKDFKSDKLIKNVVSLIGDIFRGRLHFPNHSLILKLFIP